MHSNQISTVNYQRSIKFIAHSSSVYDTTNPCRNRNNGKNRQIICIELELHRKKYSIGSNRNDTSDLTVTDIDRNISTPTVTSRNTNYIIDRNVYGKNWIKTPSSWNRNPLKCNCCLVISVSWRRCFFRDFSYECLSLTYQDVMGSLIVSALWIIRIWTSNTIWNCEWKSSAGLEWCCNISVIVT